MWRSLQRTRGPGARSRQRDDMLNHSDCVSTVMNPKMNDLHRIVDFEFQGAMGQRVR